MSEMATVMLLPVFLGCFYFELGDIPLHGNERRLFDTRAVTDLVICPLDVDLTAAGNDLSQRNPRRLAVILLLKLALFLFQSQQIFASERQSV